MLETDICGVRSLCRKEMCQVMVLCRKEMFVKWWLFARKRDTCAKREVMACCKEKEMCVCEVTSLCRKETKRKKLGTGMQLIFYWQIYDRAFIDFFSLKIINVMLMLRHQSMCVVRSLLICSGFPWTEQRSVFVLSCLLCLTTLSPSVFCCPPQWSHVGRARQAKRCEGENWIWLGFEVLENFLICPGGGVIKASEVGDGIIIILSKGINITEAVMCPQRNCARMSDHALESLGRLISVRHAIGQCTYGL